MLWKDPIGLEKENYIQLLESPIPTTTPATSQKASSGNISGTKRGIIHRSAGVKRNGKQF